MQREIRIQLDVNDEEDYARVVNAVWATVLAATGQSRGTVLLDPDADIEAVNAEWYGWTEWAEADRF